METFDVRTPDGRTLEVLTGGAPDGFPWLFHLGSPSAAVVRPSIDEAARDLGLRLVTYSRPGYGASTPRPLPNDRPPRIADDVPDMVNVLDHLGVEEFVTLGWSGGGPRALACGALLADRCRAVATLAGAAPYDGAGLVWDAGMAPENVAEYTAARAGADTYEAYLERDFLPVLQASAEEIAESLGGLVTPVDRAALDDGWADYLAQLMHRAGAQGVRGARDDGLTIVQPWGFDLSEVRVPVAVWQGRDDAMVPFAHGEWLAAHVPGAAPHLLDDEGHVSLLARMPEILADLKQLGGVD